MLRSIIQSFFSSIRQEVYSLLSWVFMRNKPGAPEEKDLAPAFYSMAIGLCKQKSKSLNNESGL